MDPEDSELSKKLHQYMSQNEASIGEKTISETGKYSSEYFSSVEISVPKFQEQGVAEHHVRWTGANEF